MISKAVISFVTLGKTTNSLALQFLLCAVEMMVSFTGLLEKGALGTLQCLDEKNGLSLLTS